MAAHGLQDLADEEILNLLNNSDFEGDDDKDEEYNPPGHAHDSSSSSAEDDGPISFPLPASGRGMVPRRGRGRSRGSRSMSSHRVTADLLPLENEQEAEWQSKNFRPPIPQLTEPNYQPVNSENFSNVDYFDQYFDDSMIQLITEKTNQTSISITGRSLYLTDTECKKFIAITMMMSCINLPYIRMYWEQRWRVPVIATAMPRNRFFQLRSSLKIVFDNDISQELRARDKLWKVRPLIERVLQGCHKQVRNQHISIDEMIVPFSGSCGIKQYCPNKPNPVGLKAFVLANPDGTVCDFTVYQGKTTYPEENAAGFGLGESAVLNLTRSLVPGHIIYFDRYFTSVKLAKELLFRGHRCAGTIMKNRVPATLRTALPDDAEMKRRGRGADVVYVNADSIACTKWFDNKPVVLLSTIYGSEPQDECHRWCKSRREYITIQRPIVIKMYNANMGGVDMADRMLAVCPSRARTKKWTIRFISHMIDLSASNAWIQYRKTELSKRTPSKNIQSLRQWKLTLAESLMNSTNTEQERSSLDGDVSEENRKRGRPSVNPLPSKMSRLSNASHMPIFTTVTNRCRREGCNKRSSAKCSACNVVLCLTSARNCYKIFHEE